MSILLSLAAAAVLAAKPPPDAGAARFALTGSLTAAPPRSLDGRFELSASARATDARPGDAARFQLKSLNGGSPCGVSTDPIFRNGFE